MQKERNEIAWLFNFGLEAVDNRLVPESVAEELLEHLVEWAEARNLAIGGGYHGDSESSRYEEVEQFISELPAAKEGRTKPE